eukprot:4539694-Alexandrium_andersonii.AAC.1
MVAASVWTKAGALLEQINTNDKAVVAWDELMRVFSGGGPRVGSADPARSGGRPPAEPQQDGAR